jgi:hypothetical protein
MSNAALKRIADEDTQEKPDVRTSAAGGKYIVSEEAIRTRRFKRQLARLKAMFESARARTAG